MEKGLDAAWKEECESMVDKAKLLEAWDTANAVWANRRATLFNAAEAEANAKSVYGLAESTAILSGKIVGKNEGERKAAAAAILASEALDLDKAEAWVRQARYDLDTANNEIERIKLVVRLLEVV